MNIYFHELRAYRKSTFIWSVSLMVLVLFFMSMFPSISKDAEEFKKLLEGYPLAVRKALGLEMNYFFSVIGFYSYSFLYISLLGAIQAMNLGISIVSKEVREKTADFLLTKPVTRTEILTAKLLAAITALLLTNIAFIIASSIVINHVALNDFNDKVFLLISFTLLYLQIIFLAIGIIISVLVRKIKSVLTVSLATVFTFFIIAMISSTSGDDIQRYLSPFKYFDPGFIMKNSHYEVTFMLVGGFIVIMSIVVSYLVYNKKNIHAG
jgi:ABC-2 type transport system permease protein